MWLLLCAWLNGDAPKVVPTGVSGCWLTGGGPTGLIIVFVSMCLFSTKRMIGRLICSMCLASWPLNFLNVLKDLPQLEDCQYMDVLINDRDTGRQRKRTLQFAGLMGGLGRALTMTSVHDAPEIGIIPSRPLDFGLVPRCRLNLTMLSH